MVADVRGWGARVAADGWTGVFSLRFAALAGAGFGWVWGAWVVGFDGVRARGG